MNVQFTATYKDFAETAFHAWKSKNPASRYLKAFIYYAFLIAGIGSIPVLFLGKGNWWAGMFTFICIFALSFYVYFKSIPTKTYFYRECRKIYGDQVINVLIELSENGIKATHLGDEYFFVWQNILNVEETEDRLFFNGRYRHEVSIPKRAFVSTDDFGRFLIFGKSRVLSDSSPKND